MHLFQLGCVSYDIVTCTGSVFVHTRLYFMFVNQGWQHSSLAEHLPSTGGGGKQNKSTPTSHVLLDTEIATLSKCEEDYDEFLAHTSLCTPPAGSKMMSSAPLPYFLPERFVKYSICVYNVRVCVSTCECTHNCVCVCEQRSESNVDVLSDCSPRLFLRQYLSLHLGVTDSAGQ